MTNTTDAPEAAAAKKPAPAQAKRPDVAKKTHVDVALVAVQPDDPWFVRLLFVLLARPGFVLPIGAGGAGLVLLLSRHCNG